jgi:hypothetical protein
MRRQGGEATGRYGSGPLRAQRQLPLHLDASARTFYDFGSAHGRAQAHQLVLLEATYTADLEHRERSRPY